MNINNVCAIKPLMCVKRRVPSSAIFKARLVRGARPIIHEGGIRDSLVVIFRSLPDGP